MNQTEHSGYSLLQIACKHNTDGICNIATQLAGCKAKPTWQDCKYCSGLKEPKTENMLTLALARRCAASPEVSDDLFVKMKAIAKGHAEKTSTGPGTELKKLIWWFYSPGKNKCRCQSRIAKMNKWGVDKCWDERGIILLWLRQSAKIAKLPYVDLVGLILLSIAIRRARRRKLHEL